MTPTVSSMADQRTPTFDDVITVFRLACIAAEDAEEANSVRCWAADMTGMNDGVIFNVQDPDGNSAQVTLMEMVNLFLGLKGL